MEDGAACALAHVVIPNLGGEGSAVTSPALQVLTILRSSSQPNAHHMTSSITSGTVTLPPPHMSVLALAHSLPKSMNVMLSLPTSKKTTDCYYHCHYKKTKPGPVLTSSPWQTPIIEEGRVDDSTHLPGRALACVVLPNFI